MAEEKTEETKQGGSKLTLILVGVVAIAIGAGGTFAVTSFLGSAPPEAEAVEGEEGGEEAAAAEEPFEERLVSLEPFVVNLGSGRPPRYLKLTLALEASTLADKASVEARTAKIRDAIIVLLSSRRPSDLEDFDGKALLKEEVLQRINSTLGDAQVASVLFTELVVQ